MVQGIDALVSDLVCRTDHRSDKGVSLMTASSLVTIPARKGKAAMLARGQQVKIINTHGQQVIDTWAFNRADLTECLSTEHSRAALSRIMARVGDSMVTHPR